MRSDGGADGDGAGEWMVPQDTRILRTAVSKDSSPCLVPAVVFQSPGMGSLSAPGRHPGQGSGPVSTIEGMLCGRERRGFYNFLNT